MGGAVSVTQATAPTVWRRPGEKRAGALTRAGGPSVRPAPADLRRAPAKTSPPKFTHNNKQPPQKPTQSKDKGSFKDQGCSPILAPADVKSPDGSGRFLQAPLSTDSVPHVYPDPTDEDMTQALNSILTVSCSTHDNCAASTPCLARDSCSSICFIGFNIFSAPPLSWIIYEFLHLVPDNSVLKLLSQDAVLLQKLFTALECPHVAGLRAIAEFACVLISTLSVQRVANFLVTHQPLLNRCIILNCDSQRVFAAVTTLLVNTRFFLVSTDLPASSDLPVSMLKAVFSTLAPAAKFPQTSDIDTSFLHNAAEIIHLCIQCLPAAQVSEPELSSPTSANKDKQQVIVPL